MAGRHEGGENRLQCCSQIKDVFNNTLAQGWQQHQLAARSPASPCRHRCSCTFGIHAIGSVPLTIAQVSGTPSLYSSANALLPTCAQDPPPAKGPRDKEGTASVKSGRAIRPECSIHTAGSCSFSS
jgi:hypothetical protein